MQDATEKTKPPTDSPRIYVACLASYNSGILHGAWIAADQDPDDIHAEIQAMLRTSREPVAQEHAISVETGVMLIATRSGADVVDEPPVALHIMPARVDA